MGLRRDLPRIDVRIGLATGELVVGHIGSDVSRSFTVMGDTVTLASRLEGCNKHYGRAFSSQKTPNDLPGPVVETREIDLAVVSGKYEAVRSYELIGGTSAVATDTLELRDLFQERLAAYRAENWDAAEGCFAACLALRPSDGPSRVFVQRIADFRQRPPASDWNGAWHLTTK
jgi:adenylate cyclase